MSAWVGCICNDLRMLLRNFHTNKLQESQTKTLQSHTHSYSANLCVVQLNKKKNLLAFISIALEENLLSMFAVAG